MKKLLILLMITVTVALPSVKTAAQSVIGTDWVGNDTRDQNKHTVLDTLTNATTKTKNVKITGKAEHITFQLNRINISNGGTNGGTWDIYGSTDGGAKYYLITTMAITSPTTQYGYTINGNPCTNYRYIITDVSTQVSSYQGYVNVER